MGSYGNRSCAIFNRLLILALQKTVKPAGVDLREAMSCPSRKELASNLGQLGEISLSLADQKAWTIPLITTVLPDLSEDGACHLVQSPTKLTLACITFVLEKETKFCRPSSY
jgi:hypothetical protein